MSNITGLVCVDESGKLTRGPKGQVKALVRAPAVQCDHGVSLLGECEECEPAARPYKVPCGMCSNCGHYPIGVQCPQCEGSGWLWVLEPAQHRP